MDRRLRAVCDLLVPSMREDAGMHEYDGVVLDLSEAGVRDALGRLGGPALDDPHDEAHLRAFEDGLRVQYGELESHRWNPYEHVSALDLAVYDRQYAPAAVRTGARQRHLAGWPDAVDTAMASLDQVSRPVAEALLPSVRGLASAVDPAGGPVAERALAAHGRLVGHLERAERDGAPDAALGAGALARLLGAWEASEVDLGRLARSADGERNRLRALLADACEELAPGQDVAPVVARLLDDHPAAHEVIDEARAITQEVIDFTRDRGLVPGLDGECRVGPAPPSRRHAMAMLAWAGPFEAEAPSWYYITPPEPDWPEADREDWLSVFSRTTLAGITIHEVAPGHFAHGRALRRAPTDVRRALLSYGFAEGWAHYVEELVVEEGFRAGDARYRVGVALGALARVTRLAVSIGLHSGSMTVDEAVARFREDAFLRGPAARSEALRATWDPTYGRYTWGKLALRELRGRAEVAWGSGYSNSRFHASLLELGSPPLGLLSAALDLTEF